VNLTYLAVTGGIVLATMLVYALLSWGREPRQQEPDEPLLAEPELAPTTPPKRKRPAADPPVPALAGKRPSRKPRRDPS